MTSPRDSQITIPVPNKGLARVLMSPDTKKCMALVAQDAYRHFAAAAPRRTGDMVASTKATVTVSNKARGMARWQATLIIGADYGVWNQTGAGPGMHPRSTGNRPIFGPFEGAYTFNEVVALMKGENA